MKNHHLLIFVRFFLADNTVEVEIETTKHLPAKLRLKEFENFLLQFYFLALRGQSGLKL